MHLHKFSVFFGDILWPRKRNRWKAGDTSTEAVGTNGFAHSNTFYLAKVQKERKYKKNQWNISNNVTIQEHDVVHFYMNTNMGVCACGLYVTFVYKHGRVLMLHINTCSHSCTMWHMVYFNIALHTTYACRLICFHTHTRKTPNTLPSVFIPLGQMEEHTTRE